MWAIWILRSYIDHGAHPLSDLVAERKLHGLFSFHISRGRILPYVPRYSPIGLLGRSSGRDHAPWEVPLLVSAPGWEFAFGSDSEGAKETGEKKGEAEGHCGIPTGFRKLVNCSPGNRLRRWESQLLAQPARRLGQRVKSALPFLFAYL